MVNPGSETIATKSAPACYLCGAVGHPLYQNLKDRLFGTPGTWNLKQCPDPNCGLVWLDPMPKKEDIGKAYEDYFTHANPDQQVPEIRKSTLLMQARLFVQAGYFGRAFGYPPVCSPWQKAAGLVYYLLPYRRVLLDRSFMGLRVQTGGRLLDVGCGSGDLMARMQSLGWQVEGVDLDPKAIEHAQSRGLEARHGTLEAQEYSDNYFDVITMTHVIEHVHDPAGLLRECRRILHPGGYLVMVTPNIQSWGHRLFKDAWRGLEPPRHLYLYSSRSLPALAKAGGLAILSLDTSAYMAPYIYWASGAIKEDSPIGSHAASVRERLFARGFFWVEWALLKVNPNLGEELILIGTKN